MPVESLLAPALIITFLLDELVVIVAGLVDASYAVCKVAPTPLAAQVPPVTMPPLTTAFWMTLPLEQVMPLPAVPLVLKPPEASTVPATVMPDELTSRYLLVPLLLCTPNNVPPIGVVLSLTR